jgi:hypothetical protein
LHDAQSNFILSKIQMTMQGRGKSGLDTSQVEELRECVEVLESDGGIPVSPRLAS